MNNLKITLALLSATLSLSAQTSDKALYTVDKQIPAYLFSPQTNTNGAKKVRARGAKAESSYLKNILNLNGETTALLSDTLTDIAGGFHESYKEYYKGIVVENTRCIIHYDSEGNVTMVNGNFRTIDDLSTDPVLSEKVALQAALQAVGAQKYAWEDAASEQLIKLITDDDNATNYPQGSLVVYVKDATAYLAYKFAIHAVSPEQNLSVYVDAASGKVVDQVSHINHATATVQTRYAGQRDIETQYYNSSYRLRDYTRGNGILTYKYNYNYLANDYYSTDNTWTNLSTYDRAALDVHWGIEKTYDFYYSKFGRNSYDNNGAAIRSFVNYPEIDNAMWIPTYNIMVYGAGVNNNTPFVGLDLTAHELTHGVTEASSNLIYKGESGAINEGLSDVFATCVENYAMPEKGDNIWIFGDDVGGDNTRSMKNPDCKYYNGAGWINPDSTYDNGGVHKNSGVFNYWFYLLATDGEPDLTPSDPSLPPFPSMGIGLDRAIQICYLMNTAYLTPTSKFEDARICSQAAAIALRYSHLEMYHINKCWDAVGVANKTSVRGPDGLFRTCEFYVEDVPEGAYVKWSTQSSTASITPLNDDNTRIKYTYPMFDTPTYIDDVITAKIVYDYGSISETISNASKTVRVYGHPEITDIYLFFDDAYIVRVYTTAGTSVDVEASWSGESVAGTGTVTFTEVPHPKDASYVGRTQFFRRVIVSQNGYYDISAKIGTYDEPFTKRFYLTADGETLPPLGLGLAPNPATDVVTLTLTETSAADGITTNAVQQTAKKNISNDEFQVQLWNESTLVRRTTGTGNSCQLNVADLPAGLYYVVVLKNGETYRQKLIVK